MIVDPTGKFVYVANYVSSNISGYAINSTTGALTDISGSPFSAGSEPKSVTVDPTGKFVYVVNFNDGDILGYTINPTTGALTSIGILPTGGLPLSVITTLIPTQKPIICESSSASDVPGNSVLCYDPSVPLVNYLPPQRTFLAGGTKWPQYSWQPGDNGFPRGKKGMRMLFQ